MDANPNPHSDYNRSQTVPIWACRYIVDRGWNPVPVPYRQKKPILEGWPSLRLTVEDVPTYFPDNKSNVGILLGASRIGDVDLDCVEAVTLGDSFLPPTASVFGRRGKPRSHRLYRPAQAGGDRDNSFHYQKFVDPEDGATLLELRAGDNQTVVPPSVHECGELISWVQDGDPVLVQPSALRKAVMRLAAASLLAKHWPAVGSRQDAALALAGGLLRAGWVEEEARAFIEAVCHASNDEESPMRIKATEYTARRLEADKAATGWHRLSEIVGERVVGKVREWLGATHDTYQDNGTRSEAQSDDGEEALATGKKGSAPPSQSTRLVQWVQDAGVQLWHTSNSECYASFPMGDHTEHHPLKKDGFRQWLSRQFYMRTGAAAGAQAIQDALNTLVGIALYDGLEQTVQTRVARHEGEGAIYLDLANARWQAVKIMPDCWQIVDDPPVRFKRSPAMAPLPLPLAGGKVGELRQFLNLSSDSDYVLLLAFLIMALRPEGPYPVLSLTGEQGTAKSTMARIVRKLLDPNSTPLRRQPKDSQDLMIAASNGWVIALDNLSYLSETLSNDLCSLSTGGGLSTRAYYTDNEERLFTATRPIVLTSIKDVITRSDLLDRALILSLKHIPNRERRTEAEYWRAFDTSYPRILAGLLDAVSAAMRNLPNQTLAEKPRMADFLEWASAAEPGLGLKQGAVLSAYTGNRAEAHSQALDATPVSAPLIALVTAQQSGVWQGTAANLLAALSEQMGFTDKTKRPEGWPKDPTRLSGQLKENAPNLRSIGFDVQFNRSGSKGRTIVIRRIGSFSDTSDTGDTITQKAASESDAEGDAGIEPSDAVARTGDAGDAVNRDDSNGRAVGDSSGEGGAREWTF